MQTPLISIVLCTYNGERFLKEQIDSIVNQTYPDLEIIISDDCSADSTRAIINNYRNFDNIKIIFNEKNKGFTKNFEFAATLASGNYLAFSDQDDIWLPEKIEKLYHAISKYSLVYSDSKLINDSGAFLNKKLSDFRKFKKTIHDSRGFAFFNVVSGHTILIKKELLLNALPIPDGYYHDWWLAYQAANLKGAIFLDEALTLYRQHHQTITKTIPDRQVVSRKFEKRYQDFMKELLWIEKCKNNESEKHKTFFTQLYDLFILKKRNVFVWSLFYFLIKNEKAIFQFSNKGYLSKLVEMRKMARGERTSSK
jgi:glycosyltransferase involved in cell wall biosynthesis